MWKRKSGKKFGWVVDLYGLGGVALEEFGDSRENLVIHEKKDWDFRRIEEEIKCRFWSWCVEEEWQNKMLVLRIGQKKLL